MSHKDVFLVIKILFYSSSFWGDSLGIMNLNMFLFYDPLIKSVPSGIFVQRPIKTLAYSSIVSVILILNENFMRL